MNIFYQILFYFVMFVYLVLDTTSVIHWHITTEVLSDIEFINISTIDHLLQLTIIVPFHIIIPITTSGSKVTIIEVVTTTPIHSFLIIIHIHHSITALDSLTHCVLYVLTFSQYHFFTFYSSFTPFQFSILFSHFECILS